MRVTRKYDSPINAGRAGTRWVGHDITRGFPKSAWKRTAKTRPSRICPSFKEFRTRSASSTGRLAILWTVVTPIVSASTLALMWSFLGRKEFYGVSTFLVMSVSIIPYFPVRHGFNSIPAAIWQNSGLYGYPMVKPIDAVIARFVLDITLTSVAGIAMLLGLYWFAGITPQLYYPLEALGIYAITLVMVLGVSLIVGVYSALSDSFRRIMGFLTRPLIMVSLVIHLGSGLPEDIRYWVSWNPLADLNELIRFYMLGLTPMPEATVEYPALVSLLLLALGMIVYQANRYRIIRAD
jgi:capsular polysaccharide transport system permease protein